jgi:hypothetical protein
MLMKCYPSLRPRSENWLKTNMIPEIDIDVTVRKFTSSCPEDRILIGTHTSVIMEFVKEWIEQVHVRAPFITPAACIATVPFEAKPAVYVFTSAGERRAPPPAATTIAATAESRSGSGQGSGGGGQCDAHDKPVMPGDDACSTSTVSTGTVDDDVGPRWRKLTQKYTKSIVKQIAQKALGRVCDLRRGTSDKSKQSIYTKFVQTTLDGGGVDSVIALLAAHTNMVDI